MASCTTCNWCAKNIDSIVTTSNELFCCSTCKEYYNLDIHIMHVLDIAIVNGREMKIDKAWNRLFNLLFKSSLCLYAHHRDDIGIELGWLYEIYMLSTKNNLNSIRTSIVIEHLNNFLYFLRHTTK
ncbi:unnamed protein product [Rotaria socialis]|uniref:Uncharacterized protein n=1 Tax=Rotaria socialis TaxID=392032 RepID=A0A820M4C4_9BILA|nr:unnamed protein product [Rotaria socialis]CAF3453902.1 unnamed protein product [Rotaria socialis]CAF3468514.1 unnamed protein product [Rotaria socialis]CAF3613102.1 unnamed protein product [Rotaria socialis]CAF3618247.1 unnamed protein product [Rotaria socialis]